MRAVPRAAEWRQVSDQVGIFCMANSVIESTFLPLTTTMPSSGEKFKWCRKRGILRRRYFEVRV
jgi:hypothetical protein